MNTNPKLVLVTGASSGFGEACCRLFASNGWTVLATARRVKRLEKLQAELGSDRCYIQKLDVTQSQSVDSLAAWLKKHCFNVDCLVNNAGLALGLSPAHEADESDWQRMIDTNISGLTKVTRAILPDMVERQQGHVINIGSIAGSYPYPGGNVYGATKAFVEQFSLNLRADLAGTKVRVTNIEPGLANTEFSTVRFHGDRQKADSIYAGLEPLLADDIASAIYWVATQPQHVNINRMEIMPTCQSFSALAISH